HLDHLAWLGVGGIWLSPTMPSPNVDWGYDVADYRDVDAALGTLADLDELVATAGGLGIRVLLDLVPNHTSDRHPWFLDARSAPRAAHRDWYVWADPGADGAPPNNWLSFAGGPAWTLDEAAGQLYLHNYMPGQPDLNWWNPEVRDAFDGILRFWFDRGIAGFRIDTANRIVKDRLLRDNPPARDTLHRSVTGMPLEQRYSANRPEVHEVFRRWRRIADGYRPGGLLLGETFLFDLAAMAAYHGNGDDELQLALNLPFMFSPLEAEAMRDVVTRTAAALPEGAWPLWTGSSHDVPRLATRWCDGDPARVRCALLLLLTLRGTPQLYYGDEIGMGDSAVPPGRVRDPLGLPGSARAGRDGARTPMRWNGGPGAGFTAAGVEPWLPTGTEPGVDVASQRDDPGSVLHLCRDAVRLRALTSDLREGGLTFVPAPPGVLAWRRGDSVTVALNLGDRPATLDGVEGTVVLGTDRERDGTDARGDLELGGWEGAVVVA
ncbi:MAG TPA: alpha-amylase family glycosyl hydrolase, partial [Candidatus Dormibacteraeota bacterium]